jgi:hypothetical protein
MAYPATVIEVLIASPGDVKEERQAAREVILDWNRKFTKRVKLVLQPRMWELDGTPEIGSDPQDLINRQFVRDCDLVIAIFWTRLGTKTPRADSGTVEEISEHAEAGKPALIYFSSRPIAPREIDFAQYQSVETFYNGLREKAVLGRFSDSEDFRRRLFDHLDSAIHTHFKTGAPALITTEPIQPNHLNLNDKALALLSGTAKTDNKHLIRMNTVTGPQIWCQAAVFHQGSDSTAAIGWDSAIDELLYAGLLRDLNGKGQIFQLTQKGLDFLERGPRDRFSKGTDVYVRAKTRTSPANLFSSKSEKQSDYIVRMPRTLVEREGIEWNYDYILRDLDFQHQILTKVSEIETSVLGGGAGLQATNTNIESLQFYEGDPKSLPANYKQMGGGCLIWENPPQ